MKNIFKSLMIVVLFVGLGSSAFAQPTGSADLTASATVLTNLTIAQTSALNFGNLSATTLGDVVVDPTTAAVHTNTGVVTVGQMTIIGNPGSTVQLAYEETITLLNGETPLSNGADGEFTLNVIGGLNQEDAVTKDAISFIVLATEADVTSLDATTPGEAYLWVGGNLGTLATAATGTYTGTATFTVIYN